MLQCWIENTRNQYLKLIFILSLNSHSSAFTSVKHRDFDTEDTERSSQVNKIEGVELETLLDQLICEFVKTLEMSHQAIFRHLKVVAMIQK